MNEIVSLADTIKDVGVPMLFCAVIFYALYKAVPVLVKAKQEADKKQQEYYDNRQKQYDEQSAREIEQMKEIVKVAEQCALGLSRSTTAIENSTEVMKQSTALQDKVIDALTREYAETQAIQESLNNHDRRAEKIHLDVVKIGERL